jgi:hypothetical protein
MWPQNIQEVQNMADLESLRKEGNYFIVKQPDRDTFVKIEDAFAEK